jgi:hypothetical protein
MHQGVVASVRVWREDARVALTSLLFALLTVVALVPAQAQAPKKPFYSSQNWIVTTGKHSCWVIGGFDDETALLIQYDASQNAAIFMITSKRFSSLEQGEAFMLDVDFIKGRDFVARYPDVRFVGHRLLVEPSIMSKVDAKFLQEFATADMIGVSFQDQRVLGSYDLDGAGDAVAALKRCARIEGGFAPDDPFAGEPRQ